MSVGSTWADTYTFQAPHLVEATTIAHVQEAVASAQRVRALGTRHSFNDLADTSGTLVTVTGIAPEPQIDTHARTVSVGAGVRYGELATWLEAQGWALHNMGSLPHISVGGAIATGTHGSGAINGSLAAAVAGLIYVNAAGDLVTVRRGDADFDALVVGLGAYGITVRVTLDIQPSYEVRQDVYTGMTWDALLANLDAVLDAAYSVSVFTMWGADTIDQVWRKTRLAQGTDGNDIQVPDAWLDATRSPQTGARLVDGDPAWLTEQGGVVGRWLDRLPHFRLDQNPSNGHEIQTEYFVDRANGVAALEAVREFAHLIDPVLLITELRTVAADGLWLSGAYQRDTLAIHFTLRHDADQVHQLLPHIEEALAPFAARPHWGKVHRFAAPQIDDAYPRVGDVREVWERLDPGAKFSNAHLERLGLRAL